LGSKYELRNIAPTLTFTPPRPVELQPSTWVNALGYQLLIANFELAIPDWLLPIGMLMAVVCGLWASDKAE
jgi:hypothetical protein